MSNLSIQEIVLLNCFNYLNIGNQNDERLGKVINYFLNSPDRFKELTIDNPASIEPEGWKEILTRIQKNKKLCSLTIAEQSQTMGYIPQGLNAVCFIDDKSRKAIFVFRGTGRGEWLDNGEAFAKADSPQQLEALEYFQRAVNELELVDQGYIIDVTGHSKGGNKAQFVAINSDIVNECYSFDGQGFSKEALEKYKDRIQHNAHRIISIAAECDYIHCLGNEIAGKKELYKSNYSIMDFPYHHCPDAILNKNGLTEKVQNEPWQNIMINHYSRHLMELDRYIKKEVFSSFMGLAQMTLGKVPAIRSRVPSYYEAKKMLSEASYEFKSWFYKDRNQFTIGQKIMLYALGLPIIKLALPFVYRQKYESFAKLEEQAFGTLSKDIKREFGSSKDGTILQEILEFSKKDLEEMHWFIEENLKSHLNNKPISTKASEINEYYSITSSIEKNRTIIQEASIQIEKIDSFISQIKGKEKVLSDVKDSLEKIYRYKDIAQKYDKKIFFKRRYQNKYLYEKIAYDEAQEYLKSVGIRSWEDFNLKKEELDNSKYNLETLISEKNKLISIRDSIRKEIIKQVSFQKNMMKEHDTLAIKKNHSISRTNAVNREI